MRSLGTDLHGGIECARSIVLAMRRSTVARWLLAVAVLLLVMSAFFAWRWNSVSDAPGTLSASEQEAADRDLRLAAVGFVGGAVFGTGSVVAEYRSRKKAG